MDAIYNSDDYCRALQAVTRGPSTSFELELQELLSPSLWRSSDARLGRPYVVKRLRTLTAYLENWVRCGAPAGMTNGAARLKLQTQRLKVCRALLAAALDPSAAPPAMQFPPYSRP